MHQGIRPIDHSASATEFRGLKELIDRSDLFFRYRQAFRRATGRLLRLVPLQPENGMPFSLVRVPLQVEGEAVAMLTVDSFRIAGQEKDFNDFAHNLLAQRATASDLRAARKSYEGLPVLVPEVAEAISTMLQIFCIQLGEHIEKLFLQAAGAEPYTVKKARNYIMGHLADPMTLEEVASHAGVSLCHFCKVFKKATGLTFTEFVTKARIEEAKRLLLRPQSRVTEVAYEVGFQSLSQFNRSFKKVTKISPTDYRSSSLLIRKAA